MEGGGPVLGIPTRRGAIRECPFRSVESVLLPFDPHAIYPRANSNDNSLGGAS